MYWDVEMVYSEGRGTWNVIADGEWYFEGDYEQCCEVMDNLFCSDEYDDGWDRWEVEPSRDDWDADEDCFVDTLRYM